jgi:glutaredoxin
VIDKRGIIRYVDVHDFDEQPDNEELFRVLNEVEPKPVTVSTVRETVTEPEPMPEPEADVIMYCTPWCPACRKAKAYLNELGIEFIEVDITRDREAAKHLRTWTGGYETTPTFRVGGEIIVNFDRTKLDEALGNIGSPHPS